MEALDVWVAAVLRTRLTQYARPPYVRWPVRTTAPIGRVSARCPMATGNRGNTVPAFALRRE
ncbi:hypothetical protein AHAS_Ahas17G0092400 [Arachis hypogaea]